MTHRNLTLDAALEDARTRFVAANPASRAQHERAQAFMPGANTRTTLHYEPYPVSIVRGEGATLTDLDGHSYIDFLGEYTAGLYGHSQPAIIAALRQVLDAGLVLCGPNRDEVRLAELMCARFPAVERIRFCNSGTEANMMCASLARAVTGRPKIVCFRGCYHGGLMAFRGDAASPMNASTEIILLEYNDPEAVRATMSARGAETAAVVVEPVVGAVCIPAEMEFLATLREETARQGSLLIFDEVMTSRLAPGGMQERMGVIPDLAAFGKYLGGGASFGAFGGREDLMARLDPRAPDALAHSGTFNNNVLSMAAGRAGLEKVMTPEANRRLNRSGDELRHRLQITADEHGIAARITGLGSMMCIHFQDGELQRPADAEATPKALRSLLHLELMLKGFYTAPRGFMSLSLPLLPRDHDALVAAFAEFLDRNRSVLR